MRIALTMTAITTLLAMSEAHGAEGAAADAAKPAPLLAVPFTDVKIDDAFWAPRIALDRERVLPHNFRYCEEVGKVRNFLRVAGKLEGKHEGAVWEDSDLYKVIEGAAYCLAHSRDPELEKTVDDLVEKIAAAQQPDGYLDTYFTLVEPQNRWTDENKHETYCAGHLIEAAVAYFQATGKRAFLDVAIKFADHIDSVFGPGRKADATGHEELELALVKLWRVTGEDRYLKLSQFLIDCRGHREGRKPTPQITDWTRGEYCQDHKPIREQNEIVGHAVRAMYLYCGVADVAAVTGDPGYLDTMDHIWRDVTQRKMYITGGIGPSAKNEGFTVPYDLPNESAYCETCAAIGMALWNQRMTLLEADAKYADVVERELYNGALSGVSLDGVKFFYVNPLASRGGHHRQPWHGCACCPTNVVRFLPTVGGYVYAHRGRDIYVNHYIAGRGRIDLDDQSVTLAQETRYPWEGAVKITVDPERAAEFALRLRIPGWSLDAQTPEDLYQLAGKPESSAVTLDINGQPIEKFDIEKGYARIERNWKKGDVVNLGIPMPIRRIRAYPKVEADVGRVALQRGPIVYCLEGVDNGGDVRCLALPPDAALNAEHRPDLLGGVTVIKGAALAVSRDSGSPDPVEFLAVPYYAWDNREPGQMAVWIPEDPALAEPRPKPTIASESKVSASHCFGADAVDAMNDQIEPATSHDHNVPRFTWWDHRGTTEWAQYEFKTPCKVSGVEVYWFDDTGTGSCRVPKSWRVMFKEGDAWKPVNATTEYGLKPDQYNRVALEPVQTSALRIEVELQPDFSGGILEWRVLE